MPSDHRLTSSQAIHPRDLIGEVFIGGSNKAAVLRLRRSGVDIKFDQGVDNMAMAMSLVASTRGRQPIRPRRLACESPLYSRRIIAMQRRDAEVPGADAQPLASH